MDKKGSPTQDKSSGTGSILSASFSGASYLVILQLFSRLITFALNQILVRYTSPEVLGTANVQLELLLNTILFLSREGFRSALLRSEKGRQKILNLAYIPIPLGLLTSLGACVVYTQSVDKDTFNQPFFPFSIVLYGLAAVAELVVEPLYILSANALQFRLRFVTEGTAVIVRCIVTVAVTISGVQKDATRDNKYGVLAFALGQLCYGLIIAGGYVIYHLRERGLKTLVPRKIKEKDMSIWFDGDLLSLAATFTKQSILKQFLTEGDKFMVGLFSSRTDQGVYALVLNYGSLVGRILFQPTEETERILFGKLVGSSTKPSQENLKIAAEILSAVIKTHILFGLLFACFGYTYSATLLDLLVGKRWSMETAAPRVLASFCLFVPFMGLNGITEAFVQSVANERDLARQNRVMIMFSAVFFAAVIAFMKYPFQAGERGVVYANMVNLGCRIIWSRSFILEWFSRFTLTNEIQSRLSYKSYVPDLTVMSGFVACYSITSWSEHNIGWMTLDQKFKHVTIGIGCGAFMLALISIREYAYVRQIVQIVRSQRNRK